MKIGIATLEITPPFLMPMGGFGPRVDHADGSHDPLQLTAVHFSHEGREAWLVSADIIQFPDGEAFDEGVERVAKALGCPTHALFLNASHTHGSPQMITGTGIKSPAKLVHRSPKNQELIRKYQDFLWNRLTNACRHARDSAKDGRIVYGEGKTTFPMNRRALINGRIENAPNPDGDFEDRLRVIGLEDASGKLFAVGLILAAHPTSTGPQHRFTADFVGAWRDAMKRHLGDGVTPFFLQACTGDARPAFTRDGDHWRRVGLDELPQMGDHLLKEAVAVLEKGLQPTGAPRIATAASEMELHCEKLITDAESCQKFLRSSIPWEKDFAEECLRRFASGEKLPESITMRLARLQLTDDLVLLGMACEPICALGWKIEKAFSPTPIVLGYTNGCFGYLAETEELARGGYEAEFYQFLPAAGPFPAGVENTVISALRELETTNA